MMYRVIIQPEAKRQIQQAARWVYERSKSVRTSRSWAKKLEAKIATLRFSPLRCPIDSDTDEYGTEARVLLFGKPGGHYKVLFLVIGDEVRVVSVIHAARDRAADEFDGDDPD